MFRFLAFGTRVCSMYTKALYFARKKRTTLGKELVFLLKHLASPASLRSLFSTTTIVEPL